MFGAGDRGRTDTVSLPLDFESSTSANSITPANSGIATAFIISYRKNKIKGFLKENKYNFKTRIRAPIYQNQSLSISRERLRVQIHHQKEKGAHRLTGEKIAGIRLPLAASAESAAPYVSELPTAFVRFSNPNSRPSI